jgi:uncharacterized membrane protein YeaQ/YmgE (transglycosylase-associated protein family)
VIDPIFRIFIGAIAGLLASMVIHSGQGPIRDVILGVAGAIVGGIAAGAFFCIQVSYRRKHATIVFYRQSNMGSAVRLHALP